MDKAYMTKQTITFSDGTETVMNFDANGASTEIEAKVAEAVAVTSPEEVAEEVVETPTEESAEEDGE